MDERASPWHRPHDQPRGAHGIALINEPQNGRGALGCTLAAEEMGLGLGGGAWRWGLEVGLLRRPCPPPAAS